MRSVELIAACVLSIAAMGCSASPVPAPLAGKEPQNAKKTATAPTDEKPLRIDGKRAFEYTRELVAMGRRAPGSPGMAKQQAYLRAKLKGDNLEEDAFKAKTPAGEFQITNFIAKFPGSTSEIIV